MPMSRKQYRDMAAVMASEWPHEPLRSYDLATFDNAVAVYNIACGLATVFEIDNPRFDRERFMLACNIDQVEIKAKDKEREKWFKERGL